MSVTGVYYIPSNPELPTTATRTVIDRFKAIHQPTRLGRWALEFKLLRDTASCLPAANFPHNKVPTPRYMHFLSLSHYQNHGFIRISPRPEVDPLDPAVMEKQMNSPPSLPISAMGVSSQKSPADGKDSTSLTQAEAHTTAIKTLDPQSYLSFFSMTTKFCQPLWNHRFTVVVTGGEVYEVGDFRVRIGEVRQTVPRPRLRGAIVEIEYNGPGLRQSEPDLTREPEEDWDFVPLLPHHPPREVILPTDEDWELGVMLIRELWENFSIPGATESIQVPGLGLERRDYLGQSASAQSTRKKANLVGVDLARQYMDVFKFYR
ncbi:hypothetical protein MGYG_06257 [Nannizzia gypsea CBS 118893]|uniref:Mediator of RNA polymerase II transcription subunit 20 n=1 Tax=Arthroderma gypseum (strain ATCC MYA-4604 / CBS 118893) TaxID=535722 RepID=E4UYS5_ARTGP|nr:hypothetical protein MGYG_06257 [Nannizzia gypsea CBS 118893]EFR03255.1 hypothetical protein MGYG_06257 [Nannizzia gypsea CBS 118893]